MCKITGKNNQGEQAAEVERESEELGEKSERLCIA